MLSFGYKKSVKTTPNKGQPLDCPDKSMFDIDLYGLFVDKGLVAAITAHGFSPFL